MARHRVGKAKDAPGSADEGRVDDAAEERTDDPAGELDDVADSESSADSPTDSSDDSGDAPDSSNEPSDSDNAEEPAARSAKIDAFWEKLGVQPVEIAMPRGVGHTLRAYRMSDTLADADLEGDEELESEDVKEADVEDTDSAKDRSMDTAKDGSSAGDKSTGKKTAAATKRSTPATRERVAEDLEEDADAKADLDDEDYEDGRDDEDAELEAEEEAEPEEKPEPEEVPVFLVQDRRLLLFRSPEGLVEFVRSRAANDLDVIEEWETLCSEVTPEHIAATPEDRYELDLVVENLRGGHDAWEAELLIKAGEVCRDLGHALEMESVIGALSPGSPLDDLDEALRATENGRIGGFFARRKLRRVGAQQAALAWRSIIGKISTSVDWRD